MKLSDESTAKFKIKLVNKQIQKIKQAINTWTKELINTIETLRKHIETLQKENDGWQKRYYELDAGHSRLFKDFCKLQQENEQLQTQMTQIKKAIQKLKETINAWDKATWFECPRCGNIRDTLTTITKIIGGAEDGSCKNK